MYWGIMKEVWENITTSKAPKGLEKGHQTSMTAIQQNQITQVL